MRALAKENDTIRSKGALLIAVSPELPEFSKSTAQANEVPFTVLSDPNLKAAAKYGLVFDLDYLTELYENFAKLSEKNGEESKSKLPLTPTYIIDQSATIRYAFNEIDYRKRAEPSDVIAELDKVIAAE